MGFYSIYKPYDISAVSVCCYTSKKLLVILHKYLACFLLQRSSLNFPHIFPPNTSDCLNLAMYLESALRQLSKVSYFIPKILHIHNSVTYLRCHSLPNSPLMANLFHICIRE